MMTQEEAERLLECSAALLYVAICVGLRRCSQQTCKGCTNLNYSRHQLLEVIKCRLAIVGIHGLQGFLEYRSLVDLVHR